MRTLANRSFAPSWCLYQKIWTFLSPHSGRIGSLGSLEDEIRGQVRARGASCISLMYSFAPNSCEIEVHKALPDELTRKPCFSA